MVSLKATASHRLLLLDINKDVSLQYVFLVVSQVCKNVCVVGITVFKKKSSLEQ